uniref:Uncharacterized protein n=1 Tax=Oryza brachyantha TaxID=4533 RepID=J3M2B1_ORYBR
MPADQIHVYQRIYAGHLPQDIRFSVRAASSVLRNFVGLATHAIWHVLYSILFMGNCQHPVRCILA